MCKIINAIIMRYSASFSLSVMEKRLENMSVEKVEEILNQTEMEKEKLC